MRDFAIGVFIIVCFVALTIVAAIVFMPPPCHQVVSRELAANIYEQITRMQADSVEFVCRDGEVSIQPVKR